LDIGRKVNDFTGFELLDSIKYDRTTMMVGALEVTGQPNAADIFAALGRIGAGNLIFRVDREKWALWHTGAAINAGLRVDVNPRPFFLRVAGDHTFNGANVDAATVANA
jgi:hypothetical protein